MRVLLDTHAFLWVHSEPERLGPHLQLLERRDTERLVSAVVGWEITIKHGLGRLALPLPPQEWVPDRIRRGAMTEVPIAMEHVLGVAELANHHRDPFDRLLISQAQSLRVPILTADRSFDRYGIDLLRIES